MTSYQFSNSAVVVLEVLHGLTCNLWLAAQRTYLRRAPPAKLSRCTLLLHGVSELALQCSPRMPVGINHLYPSGDIFVK